MVTTICSLYSSVEPHHNEMTNYGAFCYECERGRAAHPQALEGSTLQLDHNISVYFCLYVIIYAL